MNRGVALWKDKVYVGAFDGRLIALDARSGRVIWSVDTTGHKRNYSITGAPRVVKGKVIIGNGGADFGARGFISAYDADTGALAWRFYIVPRDPKQRQHVFNNLHRYGNTSAGSVPLALDEAMAENRIKPGDLVVLSGFGAGLTWGTAVVRW